MDPTKESDERYFDAIFRPFRKSVYLCIRALFSSKALHFLLYVFLLLV